MEQKRTRSLKWTFLVFACFFQAMVPFAFSQTDVYSSLKFRDKNPSSLAQCFDVLPESSPLAAFPKAYFKKNKDIFIIFENEREKKAPGRVDKTGINEIDLKELKLSDASIYCFDEKNEGWFQTELRLSSSNNFSNFSENNKGHSFENRIGMSLFIKDNNKAVESNIDLKAGNFEDQVKYWRLSCQLVFDTDEIPTNQADFNIISNWDIKTDLSYYTTNSSPLSVQMRDLAYLFSPGQSDSRIGTPDKTEATIDGGNSFNRFQVEFTVQKGWRLEMGRYVTSETKGGFTYNSSGTRNGSFDIQSKLRLHTGENDWLQRRRPKFQVMAEVECKKYWDFKSSDVVFGVGLESNIPLSDNNSLRCMLRWRKPLELNDNILNGYRDDKGRFELLFGLRF